MPKITYTDEDGTVIGSFDEESRTIQDANGKKITIRDLKNKISGLRRERRDSRKDDQSNREES